MHYEIYRKYTTGDSFGSETRTDSLGPVWFNLDVAKKAFNDIKQHCELYEKLNSSHIQRPRWQRHSLAAYEETRMLLVYYRAAQDWFMHGTQGYWLRLSDNYHSCALQLDDDTYRNVDVATHCGYFETLHEIHLVEVGPRPDLYSQDEIYIESHYF